MYDEIVLESVADTLVEQAVSPQEILDDLDAVAEEHADSPRELRRYQLMLELDADDLDIVRDRIETHVEENNG